jgi:hypothetical protein
LPISTVSSIVVFWMEVSVYRIRTTAEASIGESYRS